MTGVGRGGEKIRREEEDDGENVSQAPEGMKTERKE